MVRYDEAMDQGWLNVEVIMHVRECSPTEIRIPLHVGENRSRVWVLTRTDDEYPTVTLTGNVQKRWEPSPNVLEQFQASLVGQVSVPIYRGGGEYALVRQNKETLGQRRFDLDTTRDQARATVVQSWGLLEAAKAQIEATQAQVTAAEIALNGVREEARFGQRTTLDVLNAQQELVNARVSLVTAQRDRVVASYTLLAAVGRLSAQVLGLPAPIYDPRIHYHQIRDAWFGVRTPDGR
jgi:outer membrane protein